MLLQIQCATVLLFTIVVEYIEATNDTLQLFFCLAEKASTFFQGIYDVNDYENDDSDDDDE